MYPIQLVILAVLALLLGALLLWLALWLHHRRRSLSAKSMSRAYGRTHLWFVIRCEPKPEESKTTCDD